MPYKNKFIEIFLSHLYFNILIFEMHLNLNMELHLKGEGE